MNFIAGFEFIIILLIFGSINFIMMLKRYENDLKKRKIIQNQNIARLYPKGTFLS